jgi:hypothetical protein
MQGAKTESLPIPLIGGGLLCAYCNHPEHYGKPCGVASPWCSCRNGVGTKLGTQKRGDFGKRVN